jgi:hypothetical protein
MAKRGSVEAFKEAEARRQERINSSKASNTSDARKQKRDAFNAKVKSINESRVNKSSLDRFKKAEEDRKARVASVNKMNPNSPKAKRLRAQADVEKDLPKSAAPSPMAKDRVASAAAIGVASTAKADYLAPPKKETIAAPKKSVDLSGFGEAFKKARAEGVGTKFAYDDKMYSAVTKDDISRSGKSSLQDFLNSTKRTETTIAKAPGQREEAIVKKRSGGMADPEKKDKIKKMIASAKGAAESFRTPGMRQQRLRDRYDSMTKNMSGAAMTESEDFRNLQEAKSVMDQMQKSPAEDRFKSGGSVMARGCKLGRKKPTKLY